MKVARGRFVEHLELC